MQQVLLKVAPGLLSLSPSVSLFFSIFQLIAYQFGLIITALINACFSSSSFGNPLYATDQTKGS